VNARRAAVAVEARRWIGTPYHHHGRVLGAGVDCVQLLCAVFEACGLAQRIDCGDYAWDWHQHQNAELYLQGLLQRGAVEVAAPDVGDVALFRFGRTWSHGGLVVDGGQIVHAYLGRGVIATRMDEEPLARRKVRFFTIEGMLWD
jgi:cell wall-associated NlpC family hydrolase